MFESLTAAREFGHYRIHGGRPDEGSRIFVFTALREKAADTRRATRLTVRDGVLGSRMEAFAGTGETVRKVNQDRILGARKDTGFFQGVQNLEGFEILLLAAPVSVGRFRAARSTRSRMQGIAFRLQTVSQAEPVGGDGEAVANALLRSMAFREASSRDVTGVPKVLIKFARSVQLSASAARICSPDGSAFSKNARQSPRSPAISQRPRTASTRLARTRLRLAAVALSAWSNAAACA
jgi:hypothetical protein